MIRNKKQMYLVIGAFALVLLLGTTTYAFFNYTRTGTQNIIKTGRISFNSTQGTAMNLDNLFPIDTTVSGIMNDATKVGTVTINVTGDTTYSDGIEYLVSAVNVSNIVGSGANAKSLPISIDVSVTNNTNNDPATSLGTSDDSYFEHKGPSANTSIYKVLASDVIEENEQLLVGYIKSGATGVDGNIVIKAYIDKEKVGISDTYPTRTVRTVVTTGYSSNDCETVLTAGGVSGANAGTYCDTASDLQDAIDNEDLTASQISALVTAGIVDEYTDGTPASFGEGREVFTTTEWNSLQANGVSFQVKVEANEGTWVEEIRSVNTMNTFPTTITDQKANIKEVYFNRMSAIAMQNAYDNATIKSDLTYNNEGKVLAWLETNEIDNTKYNLIVASDGDTYLQNAVGLFNAWSSTEKIEFSNVNTQNITAMYGMFQGCSSLKSVNLSNLGSDRLNGISGIFSGCTSLSEINMSGFNFGLITELNGSGSNGIFKNLSNLKNLNLNGAKMINMISFYNSFEGLSNLEIINLSNIINTGTITGLGNMFADCSKITEIDLSSFIISDSSTNIANMFLNCASLEKIYVSTLWNVSNSSVYFDMFKGCTSLVGTSPNGTTYAFDSSDAVDKTYAVIATDTTKGYLTDISLKPTS